jgi:hypothetical protein
LLCSSNFNNEANILRLYRGTSNVGVLIQCIAAQY